MSFNRHLQERWSDECDMAMQGQFKLSSLTGLLALTAVQESFATVSSLLFCYSVILLPLNNLIMLFPIN